MNPVFYDPKISYEENYKNGPPLFNANIKPLKRKKYTTYKLFGFDVNLPFGIPAGPLLNSQFMKEAFNFGFDVNHYKTQRSIIFPCNSFPNVLYVDIDGNLTIKKTKKPLIGKKSTKKSKIQFSITNSFGIPSMGPEIWQEDMKKALSYQKSGQLLIASVVGTIKNGYTEEDYYNDFAHTAMLAKETGVKVIEINLSCPNVANEGVICYTPSAVESICKKTKEKVGNIPILAKLGYFTKDQQDLLEDVVKKISPFVHGIVAINTIPAPIVDNNGLQALPGPNRLISGVCGASIKWAGIDMVRRLNLLKERFNYSYEIIGVGGMMSPVDFTDYIKAGANAVQSATGAMWNPLLAYQIEEKIYL